MVISEPSSSSEEGSQIHNLHAKPKRKLAQSSTTSADLRTTITNTKFCRLDATNVRQKIGMNKRDTLVSQQSTHDLHQKLGTNDQNNYMFHFSTSDLCRKLGTNDQSVVETTDPRKNLKRSINLQM